MTPTPDDLRSVIMVAIDDYRQQFGDPIDPDHPVTDVMAVVALVSVLAGEAVGMLDRGHFERSESLAKTISDCAMHEIRAWQREDTRNN